MTVWPVKTLGEVCDFVRGVTYDKADARSETKSGFIPLLRATNITEKGLLQEDFVFIPSHGVRADQRLMSGDALITIASGSASVVGRSVLVEDPGEMTFGAFCGVLRPGPKILPRYLSHFMSSRSVRTAWSEAAQGTNINNLKRDDILQTECFLPPLDEQKRIVALLDAATAHVTELTVCYEQARTHANNLFTSALRNELGSNPDWPVETLGEVCDFVRGVTYDKADARSETKSGFIPLLRATNITEKGLLQEDFVFIPSHGVRADQRLMSGDALITIASGSASVVGRSVLVEDPGEMTFGAFCGVLRPGPKILPRYLSHFMSSRSVRTAWSEAAQGTNINNLKRDDILQTECLLPSLEEQKRIVIRLDSMKAKTSEMVAAYDAKLQAAKNLRQSILESAFAGDL